MIAMIEECMVFTARFSGQPDTQMEHTIVPLLQRCTTKRCGVSSLADRHGKA